MLEIIIYETNKNRYKRPKSTTITQNTHFLADVVGNAGSTDLQVRYLFNNQLYLEKGFWSFK